MNLLEILSYGFIQRALLAGTLIADLNRSRGVTVLLVTHDAGAIGQHATKMLYLDKRVIFYGSFEEFCCSDDMSTIFGTHSQHLMCHRH